MAPFVHGPYLYVGGSTISMYRLGSAKPLRSVSSACYTHVFALDSTGNLYAGNGNISWGTLSVYNARTLALRDTFGGMDNSSSLAVDANDYLYDANCSPAIVVFAPGGGRIAGEIRRGAFSVCSLGFDGSGNLYAANSSRRSISVYAPTSQPGKLKFERRITDGVHHPKQLFVEPSGRLFVANGDSVSVYAPGRSHPERVIENGIKRATAIAVDSKARIYVASSPFTNRRGFEPGWVSVYAPGQSDPLRKITRGVDVPSSLAVDPNDNLYVADSYGHAVTVYSPGGRTLMYSIKRGVGFPFAVFIGSR
ncbi:MAG: hypothetical protein WCC84_06035 [Candidatus Cybelea sp.]